MDLEITEIFKEGIADSVTVDGGSVSALVDLERSSGGDQFGTIQVADESVAAVKAASTVTIDGVVFHITDNGARESGLTTFNVQRSETDRERTNIFDMNDDQATWA